MNDARSQEEAEFFLLHEPSGDLQEECDELALRHRGVITVEVQKEQGGDRPRRLLPSINPWAVTNPQPSAAALAAASAYGVWPPKVCLGRAQADSTLRAS